MVCLLLGWSHVYASSHNSLLLNSPPHIYALWAGNAGAPSITFSPCEDRVLVVNASATENTEYYVWVFIPPGLEVVSISGNGGQVIEDPIIPGSFIAQVYFPSRPLYYPNPDVHITFRLKQISQTGDDTSIWCWAYYTREVDERPEEYSARKMSAVWNQTRLVSGNNVSLDDLVDNQTLVDPSVSAGASQHIFIDGSLLVDIDYEFGGVSTDRTIIGLIDESAIHIRNSKLTATGTIFRGCGETWDAIEVQSGGVFATREETIGRVTIQDALHGVRLLHGSKANIKTTDFVDNYVGIYSPPGSSQTLKDVDLKIEGSIFTEGDNYAAGGLHPRAGIELHDMRDFISSCAAAPGSGCSNIIKECLHGIILNNTSANLSGFQIRDLWNDETDQIATANTAIVASADFYARLTYDGYGKGSHPSFVNLADGIRLQNVHAEITNVRMENIGNAAFQNRNGFLKNVILKDNYTYTGHYGMISLGNFGSNLTVESNDFRPYSGISGDPQYGVFLANNIAGDAGIIVEDNFVDLKRVRSGIHSVNNDNVVIAENTIYGGDKATEYGIRISGGSPHIIDCNLVSRTPGGDVSDPGAGVYLQMLEGSALRCNATYDYPRGIEYFGMSLGTLMKANSLTDHRIGLLYDHEAESGIHEWLGNRWTNEYDTENGEIGARNTSDDEDKVAGSRYYVDVTPSSTHQQYGTDIESQHDWFILKEEKDSTLQCGDTGFKTCIEGPGADHELPFRAPDSLAWRIAVDSFTSNIYGDGAIWIARRQLYRRLVRWPQFVTTGSEWEGFMDDNLTSSVGIYETIRADFSSAQQPDLNLMATINANVLVQDSLQQLAKDLIEQIDSAGTGVVRDSLQALLDTELDILNNIVESIMVNYDSLMGLRVDLLEDILLANASAPDTTAWELAQQVVNNILIQGLLNGWNSVDSLQWVALENIADECPMVIGESVFQARSGLQMIDQTRHWDDDARCSMAIPRSAGDILGASTLSIFPNPANTVMYIDLTGEFSDMWKVRLFNSMGHQLALWEKPSGLHGMDLSIYPAGMYIVQATNKEGLRKQIRLVISR
jgi:hypothetical protein